MTLRISCIVVPLLACAALTGCADRSSGTQAGESAPLPGIWFDADIRLSLPEGMAWREVGPPGIALTKSSEAYRRSLYDDPAGYCTIGYGHLVKRTRCDGSEPHHFRRGVSQFEATALLKEDMKRAEWAVMTAVEPELSDAQYDALCDFVFNVGGGNFRNSTLLAVVNAGELERVPAQFRRWVLANGQRLRGLEIRREREIDLFFAGMPAERGVPPEGEDTTPIDVRAGE